MTTPTLPYCSPYKDYDAVLASISAKTNDYTGQLNCISSSSNNAPVLESIANTSRAIQGDICHSTSAIQGDICMSTASVKDSVERGTLVNLDASGKSTVALNEAVNRVGSLNLQAIERNGGEARHTTEKSSAELRELIGTYGNMTQVAVKETLKEVLLGFKDAQLDAKSDNCKLAVQAEKNYGELKFQNESNTKDIRLDICKSTDDLAREALKNKAELAAQIAECCCMVKEKIDMRASQTDALINALNTDRIRDSLAAAQQENLILRLGGLPVAAR